MSKSSPIVFYDIPSKLKPMAFSPNTWKVRMALNFKGIPYRTVWTPYPEIKPTLEALGVAPTYQGRFYTVPAIGVPNPDGTTTYISDSYNIVEYLEEKYPSPSLFPTGTRALQAAFIENFQTRLFQPLFPLCILQSAGILNEACEKYFRAAREELFNSRLEDICPPGPKREENLKQLREVLDSMAAAYSKNSGEPDNNGWLMGAEPCFADFVIASIFLWCSKVAPDTWEVIRDSHDGLWAKLLKNAEEYMEVL